MTTQITSSEFKSKLEITQAKEWGYKSVKAANKDGYNVLRTTATVNELKDAYKISRIEAEIIADGWQYAGYVKRIRVCGLDQIVFI